MFNFTINGRVEVSCKISKVYISDCKYRSVINNRQISRWHTETWKIFDLIFMNNKAIKDTALSYQNDATALVRTAITKDKAGQYAEAIQAYQGAITKFRLAMSSQTGGSMAEYLRYQIDQCQKRIGELDIALQNAPPPPPPPPPARALYDEGKQLHILAEQKIKAHDLEGARQLLMAARTKMSDACVTLVKPLTDEERRQAHLDMIALEKKLLAIA